MSSIKLKGDTSGEVTIQAPAVAGTTTLTLPNETGNFITSDSNGDVTISSGDFAVDTNTFYVDATNNRVGIGTSNPTAKFNVESTGDTGMIVTKTGQSSWLIQTLDSGAFRLYSNTVSAERMRITNSGSVGIGTSSPITKTHLSGTAPFITLQDSSNVGNGNDYGGIQWRAHNNNINAKITAEQQSGSSGGAIKFWTQTYASPPLRERMRIDQSGRVGIGTTNPATNLHIDNPSGNALVRVSSSDSDIAGIDFGDVSDSDSARIRYYNADDSLRFSVNGGLESMRIDSNGRLDVAQPVMFLGSSQAMRCNSTEYVQDATRSNGYIQFGTTIGAVGVNYFVSDANKKENIQPSTYNSSSLVENIEFVEFDWKPDAGDEGHVQVGVTAQQLKTLDEILVAELEDGSFMIKEPALVTHLAKALQEQIQKVKDLETRIQALESN